MRSAEFPVGASATIEALEADPHPLLAELREHEPVSWLPALECWLVTRHDLTLHGALGAIRDILDEMGVKSLKAAA